MIDNELGIYIHIPFCKSKCYYCDFVSYANKCNQVEKYVECMIKELSEYDLTKYNVTTIYIGGGTPSFIDSKYIVQLLKVLKEMLKDNVTDWGKLEITIEANPGTVDKTKFESYMKAGANRLSLGLQSTNNELLEEIGRIHTYEEFLEAYKLARSVGFKNINVDLMLGLPNQNIKDLKESLNKVIKLNPEHVSVYSLIVEEGTVIDKKIEDGELQLPDEEIERQMYWYVKNTLELAGFKHYEISNFAKDRKKSKHNSNCWEQKEYIGIGAAAHSYLDGKRFFNTGNLEEYMSGSGLHQISETQNEEDKRKEFMLLGLRKIEGVSVSEFKKKFVENPIFYFRKEINKLVEEGLIIVDGDWIRLTSKGLDLANIVWEEFV